MPRPGAEFFTQIPEQARVLVLDLGFLGDTIHLMPALWAVRRARPKAHLEVMVAEHVTELMSVCPWLDGVRGYPRFPKGPRWYQDIGRVRGLRAAKFDTIINLNGSDRSSLLTWASGARRRLGRVPPKASWFWSKCFTHTVEVPHGRQTLFKQRWEALAAAGFPMPADGPAFPISIPEQVETKLDNKLGEAPAFVHLSPFTTQDEKELPIQVLTEFINAANAANPELAWVFSCAPTEREKLKLAGLLAGLKRPPWRVFAGELNLVELAGLIRRSRVHMGGDSGALHVAVMTGRPTLSWWRDVPDGAEWKPHGGQHATLVGKAGPHGLEQLDGRKLEAALAKMLAETKGG